MLLDRGPKFVPSATHVPMKKKVRCLRKSILKWYFPATLTHVKYSN